jgi:hypothetical protein
MSLNTYCIMCTGIFYLAAMLRFFRQLNNEDYINSKEKIIRAGLPDIAIKFITFAFALYMLFYMKEYNPYLRMIYLGFILIFLYVNYYAWFILLPVAFYLTMVGMKWITFSSLAVLTTTLCLCFFGLSQEPYNSRKEYQWLKIYYLTVSVCVYVDFIKQLGY